MFIRWAKLSVSVLLLTLNGSAAEKTLFSDALDSPSAWFVEQMPGGQVKIGDGKMLIHDAKGCTVWFREKLKAPVSISYDAVVRSSARVSDLNCFWMASDPAHPEILFPSVPPRTGAFAEYDSLQLYYVGYGGNSNSTTRFRRYAGHGNKPLLPEHDLKSKPFLLEPDHIYHIEITARDGVAKFSRDGQEIFSFKDPQPLTAGWFGFRTVDSEIQITHFRISEPDTP